MTGRLAAAPWAIATAALLWPIVALAPFPPLPAVAPLPVLEVEHRVDAFLARLRPRPRRLTMASFYALVAEYDLPIDAMSRQKFAQLWDYVRDCDEDELRAQLDARFDPEPAVFDDVDGTDGNGNRWVQRRDGAD